MHSIMSMEGCSYVPRLSPPEASKAGCLVPRLSPPEASKGGCLVPRLSPPEASKAGCLVNSELRNQG